MPDIHVAFWNLQNLFDTDASEIAVDLEFTPIHGWTERAFERKVKNLARVIRQMNNGQGPDVLGICEIENEQVARKLIQEIGRDDYDVAHVDSPDIRGIDTSLIYSRDVFELAAQPVEHLVHLRFPTRDIFEVPLRVRATGAELTVLVNHWPSRSRGVHESEAFRLTLASHCGRIVDRLLKYERHEYLRLPNQQKSVDVLNERWDRNLLLMGDFNDEPFNRSIMEILQASNGTDHLEEPIKASRGRLPSFKRYNKKHAYLFNCMWPMLGRPDTGTHYYSRSTNTLAVLDQFIISRGLYYGNSGLQMRRGPNDEIATNIFQPEEMTTPKGRPREFNRKKLDGYSDHFPIEMVIETVSAFGASQPEPVRDELADEYSHLREWLKKAI